MLSSAQGVCVSDPIEVTVTEVPAVTCDNFAGDTINPLWRINPQAFETGSADTSFTESGGTLQIVATGTANFWGGASLASERTFSAGTTTPVTFEVERVAHSGSGSATRTGIYVTDQTRSRYVFFSDDVGEGGWTYNRKINQAGDNPTGGGININNQSVNGGRADQNLLLVDGGYNLDSGSNSSPINNVGIDFIQEFSVKTSNFSAEYGRNSSSVISVSSTTSCSSAATIPSASIRISASSSATSNGCEM